MVITAQPRFPQEILDSFIDFTTGEDPADDLARHTLLSWSTVSLACSISARKHLFSYIQLDLSDENHRPSWNSLKGILRANQHNIRDFPRKLEIGTMDCQSVNGWSGLADILGWMPRLRELVISSICGVNWAAVRGDVRRAICNLQNLSPCLTTLKLEYFYNLDAVLLLSWKNLRSLSLTLCGFTGITVARPLEFCEIPASDLHGHWDYFHLSHSLSFIDVITTNFPLGFMPTIRSMKVQHCEPQTHLLWRFFSSSLGALVQELYFTGCINPDNLVHVEIPVLNLPCLLSLDFRSQGFWVHGDTVNFGSIIAFGSASNLERIHLSFEIFMHAEALYKADGVEVPEDEAWHALDLAFTGPQFPSLKYVNIKIKFKVLDPDFEYVYTAEKLARDVVDLYVEDDLFPRLMSSASPKFELDLNTELESS